MMTLRDKNLSEKKKEKKKKKKNPNNDPSEYRAVPDSGTLDDKHETRIDFECLYMFLFFVLFCFVFCFVLFFPGYNRSKIHGIEEQILDAVQDAVFARRDALTKVKNRMQFEGQ